MKIRKISNWSDEIFAQAFVLCSITGWGDFPKTSEDYKIGVHATSVKVECWAGELWEDHGFRAFRSLK